VTSDAIGDAEDAPADGGVDLLALLAEVEKEQAHAPSLDTLIEDPPSLFANDYELLVAALRHLEKSSVVGKEPLQWTHDDATTSVEILAPEPFVRHREGFLPRESVPPRGKPYRLAMGHELVDEKLRSSLDGEGRWPDWHLLWEQHRVASMVAFMARSVRDHEVRATEPPDHVVEHFHVVVEPGARVIIGLLVIGRNEVPGGPDDLRARPGVEQMCHREEGFESLAERLREVNCDELVFALRLEEALVVRTHHALEGRELSRGEVLTQTKENLERAPHVDDWLRRCGPYRSAHGLPELGPRSCDRASPLRSPAITRPRTGGGRSSDRSSAARFQDPAGRVAIHVRDWHTAQKQRADSRSAGSARDLAAACPLLYPGTCPAPFLAPRSRL